MIAAEPVPAFAADGDWLLSRLECRVSGLRAPAGECQPRGPCARNALI